MQQDPIGMAVDKTLRDLRDVIYAYLGADPDRDKDFAFNYAGAPMPMKMVISRTKQERFVEDTKEWEEQLFKEELRIAKKLGANEKEILEMEKWESPLRKQVELSLGNITYPILQLWRLGPDFIFDIFRRGTDKSKYLKTVSAPFHKPKDFEDEISSDEGEDMFDSDDYEGPDEITGDTDLGI